MNINTSHLTAPMKCSPHSGLYGAAKYVFQIYIFPASHQSVDSWYVFVLVTVYRTSIWRCFSAYMTVYLCVCVCVFPSPPGTFSNIKSLPHAAELWCFHHNSSIQETDRPFTSTLELASFLIGGWERWVNGSVLSPDMPSLLSQSLFVSGCPPNIIVQLDAQKSGM